VNFTPGAVPWLFYNDFVSGTDIFHFGTSTCGPYTQTAGVYSTVRCKFGPAVYSVGPLLPGSGRVVQAGTTITISGAGFGVQQCAACEVTASNPQSTALLISSWSNTTIVAFLPASFGVGIARIGVTTASGYDAIDIMAGTAAAMPPAISLSTATLTFAFTVGGTTPATQSVSVANAGGGTLTYSVASNAAWLIASASASSIAISVNPTNLSAGHYKGSVKVTADGASNSPQPIAVTLTVAAAATSVVIGAIVNAASGASGAVVPGEIVTIYGSGLGPVAGVGFSLDAVTGMVDSTLAGTRVLFGTLAAPITYASANQVNAIVPYEIADQTSISMRVQYQGSESAGTALLVASAAPGAFTFNSSGRGQAAAANQDGSDNGPSSPAPKGSFLTIYFTGGGQTNPPSVTGSIAGSTLKWFTQKIAVTVGGVPAAVTFDGAAPTLVAGLGQLNIQLANDTPSGPAQPVIISVGGVRSPATATLAIF